MPDPDRYLGRTVEAYKVVEFLGEGGFAYVYRALDRNLDVSVAMKVLKPVFAYDEVFERNFRQEAHRAAKFRHPNIVAIHYAGKKDDLVFFSMELLDAGLSGLMDARGSLEEESILKVGCDVASALEFAHTHEGGLVHRDLKPDNIRFDQHGNAVVTDFGIAEAATNYTQATGTTVYSGTPHYISPEQARGRRVDGRSDIYSLGVTLYELAVGKTPFEGKDWFDLGRKHIEQEPEPPRERGAEVGEEVERAILKCLEKAPDDRYESAAAVREELTEIAEGTPAPVSIPDELWRPWEDEEEAPAEEEEQAGEGDGEEAGEPEEGAEDPREAVPDWVEAILPTPVSTAVGRLPRAVRWVVVLGVLVVGAAVAAYSIAPGAVSERLPVSSVIPFLDGGVGELQYRTVEGAADVGATFVLRFSERVRGSTVSTASVRLLGPEGTEVPSEVRPVEGGRAVEIVPRDSLAYEAEYRVELGPELLWAGGDPVVAGREVAAAFRTQPRPPDDDPPRVAETDPAAGARGVDVREAVEVMFSEPVSPATVDTGSVRLEGPGGGRVPARLFCCSGLRTLRLEPRERLGYGREYAVVFGSEVTDRAGNPMWPDTVTFRTEAAPPPAPEPEEEEEEPEPTGPGVLEVRVEPSEMRERVRVVVDGEQLGPPPVTVEEVEPNQDHAVKVIGVTEFSTHTITLYSSSHSVAPADTLELPVQLKPFGEISLNATPGGVVYIDGRRVGETPLGGYPVPAGTHVLKVRPVPADSAEYGVYETTFDLELFETLSLGSVELPRE